MSNEDTIIDVRGQIVCLEDICDVVIDQMYQAGSVGPRQREDLKILFFAGCSAIRSIVHSLDGMSEEEGDNLRTAIETEINAKSMVNFVHKSSDGKPFTH